MLVSDRSRDSITSSSSCSLQNRGFKVDDIKVVAIRCIEDVTSSTTNSIFNDLTSTSSSSNSSSSTLIICCVLFIFILLIVLFFCRRRRRATSKSHEQMLQSGSYRRGASVIFDNELKSDRKKVGSQILFYGSSETLRPTRKRSSITDITVGDPTPEIQRPPPPPYLLRPLNAIRDGLSWFIILQKFGQYTNWPQIKLGFVPGLCVIAPTFCLAVYIFHQFFF